MNKIILNLALLFLFSITSTADDGQIVITGTILPSAVVGLAPVNNIALSGTDVFEDITVDFGSSELEGGFDAISKNFYVKSNNPNGVSIKIEPDAGEHVTGGLTGESGEVIGIQYFFDGLNSYSMGDTIILTENQTDGSEEGKSFTFIPNNTSGSNYTAGIYDTVLKVTISLP
jgi:hypothetical protein